MKSVIIVSLSLAVVVMAGSLIPSVLGSSLTNLFCRSVLLGIATGPQASLCGLLQAQQLLQQQQQSSNNPLASLFQQQNPVVPVTTILTQPITNAGPNQVVSPGTPVTLDGTASTAGSTITSPPGTITQGIITAYSWVQTSGIAVSLNGPTTATPTFTAPTVNGTLAFGLQLVIVWD